MNLNKERGRKEKREVKEKSDQKERQEEINLYIIF